MNIDAVNENTILITFGDQISDHHAEQVNKAVRQIRQQLSDVVTDMIPSYSTVLVCFDLRKTDGLRMKSELRKVLAAVDELSHQQERKLVELPVYYGAEVALDMEDICRHCGLSAQEVISIHSEMVYRVYAIGFTPGFGFLGNVDSRIAMPRKSTPRTKIPAGSLAIADTQTAIYPSVTPGGWQIIGRTPLKMIDWNSESLALMEMGDQVRFRPIEKEEFISLGGNADEL